MTASFEVVNGELKITFEYQAAMEKVQPLAEDAAHYFWDKGWGDHGDDDNPIVWEDLNNVKKLKLLDQAVKRFLIDTARAYFVNDQTDTARDLATVTTGDRYIP